MTKEERRKKKEERRKSTEGDGRECVRGDNQGYAIFELGYKHLLVMPRFGTKRQGIFELVILLKNLIGRSLDDC